jgi:ABC-type branched-subunit amino acid transport system ATPase component
VSDVPRLRMFAGPNGSGKSTIKAVIRPELLGVYINPDAIEKDIRERGFLARIVPTFSTTPGFRKFGWRR